MATQLFLHHLVLAQVYFGIIGAVKMTGFVICEVLPIFFILFGICMTARHTVCVSVCLCCLDVWVFSCCLSRQGMQRGKCRVTWKEDAVVRVEPDNTAAGR